MRRKIKSFLVGLLIIGILLLLYFYLPPILSDAIYPLKYKDEIKKYSQQFGLNPNFVAAVIYTESHFNPNATSPVGARGLMQIMPQTGAGIAKELGEKYNVSKLYDPETNIRYGCKYLSGLIGKYSWSQSLPLIAYNGGVSLADRYATRGVSLNLETSYYIVKVKNAERIYNQLYGEWWNEKVQQTPTLHDLILSWLLGKK